MFQKPLGLRLRKATASKGICLLLDFDGTISEIVLRPSAAKPVAGVMKCLAVLSQNPRVKIFVISGRSKEWLAEKLAGIKAVLIGEHGAKSLPPSLRELFFEVKDFLNAFTQFFPGSLVEVKKSSISLHYRGVGVSAQKKLVDVLTRELNKLFPETVSIISGKKVFEIVFSKRNKGDVVREIIKKNQRVFFIAIGDDTTDEPMFTQVNAVNGLSICVGKKRGSQARYFVKNPSAVVEILEVIAEKS